MPALKPAQETVKIERTIDAKGVKCPMPLLLAKKEMAKISSGGILEIQVSDPNSRNDFRFWCRNSRHEFLGEKEESKFSRLFVKKKAG
ncbi:MAG: sulfurtransferase TusA family protein [Desulfobulbaceae bacterium]|nr:sulfurtransferase TusA family protein [Desulfobulbaceae bacterium]MCK5437621.1 sulfurtransferase TusA family protein [Desulfobulbaceae bacterium]MCK5544774.1 sulfurtransferase TusA family protein [Desulfobulbaceae bacterium]